MNLSIEVDVDGAVRKYRFGEVTDITIGREDDNVISPIVDSISRHHARIFFKDSSWFVKDLDSTNGSFLNDKKIEQEERLSNGDKLRFGKITATIALETQAELKSLPPTANAPVVPEKFASAPAAPAPAPAPAPAAAPAPAPAAVVDDVPELPVDDVPELKPDAPEPPKPPASPLSPITPVKKPVLGGGLKPGLKLPPRPGAAGAGLKLPAKPAGGLKPGLKLPPKPAGGLKPGLKLPTKPGAAAAEGK